MGTQLDGQDRSSPRPGGCRDPRSLTSLPQVLACLSSYQSDEAELSLSLTQLLSAHEPIISSLSRLNALLAPVDELRVEALLLSGVVSSTAQTAERIGGKVKSLDEEMKRVREAGDRVALVMDLKVLHCTQQRVPTSDALFQSSLSALASSIQSQDWESATRHCSRAMAMPVDVISGPFAEVSVVRALHK